MWYVNLTRNHIIGCGLTKTERVAQTKTIALYKVVGCGGVAICSGHLPIASEHNSSLL